MCDYFSDSPGNPTRARPHEFFDSTGLSRRLGRGVGILPAPYRDATASAGDGVYETDLGRDGGAAHAGSPPVTVDPLWASYTSGGWGNALPLA